MYIIKNGNLHIGNGKIFENYDIIIDGKLIKKIGKNLDTDGIEIIDANGCEVFPGFIDPTSSLGGIGTHPECPDNIEGTSPFHPELNMRYSIDPQEVSRQEFYKVGVTSVGVAPNSDSVMGGQIAVFKTAEDKYYDRLVKEHAGLKCSVNPQVKELFGPKNMLPKSKMGMFYIIESAFDYLDHTDEKDYTEKDKALQKVKDGKLPVFIAAATKGEINAALNVFKDINTPLYIVDGFEYDRCIDKILDRKAGVIIGNLNTASMGSKHDVDLSYMRRLIDNGNLVAFTVSWYGNAWDGREIFLWNAIEMYKAGIDAEEVVTMMSLNPAKMLGIDDVLGTIEEGKQADISIFTDHPVKTYKAHIKTSIINGKVVYNE